MRMRTLRRRAIPAILAAVVLITSAGSALAGRPDSVDPNTIAPPLNPTFTWECWLNASGTVCDGQRTTTYEAVEAIPCSEGWIYATGVAHESLRRVGDADGLALYTIGTVHIQDELSRTPEFDGIVGTVRAAWSDYYEYVIPGELDSRITTRRGLDFVLAVPGAGMIILDAGVKAWDIEDNILLERGRHDLVEDIDGALERACEALASSAP